MEVEFGNVYFAEEADENAIRGRIESRVGVLADSKGWSYYGVSVKVQPTPYSGTADNMYGDDLEVTVRTFKGETYKSTLSGFRTCGEYTNLIGNVCPFYTWADEHVLNFSEFEECRG